MTWFRALIAVLFLAFCASLRADGPDDDYVRAYHLIQEGDQLRGTFQGGLARGKYVEAQGILKKIQTVYPNWSSKAVQFRIEYIEEKLGSPQAPAPKSPTPPAESSERPPTRTPASPPAKPVPAKSLPDPKDAQIQTLNDSIVRLQSDNSVLQAKLKEALSAQPAVVDPKDMARAEERIRNIEKEKDLLKVTLDQEQASKSKLVDASALEKAQGALNDAKKELADQTTRLNGLSQEKTVLEAKLAESLRESEAARTLKQENEELKKRIGQTDNTSVTQKQLNDARKELADQSARVNALAQEKTILETKLTALSQQGEAGKTLKQANEQLKKQLAETNRGDKKDKQLTSALATIEDLKREKAALQKEKTVLEARVSTPGKDASESGRIKDLEKERDGLLKKLKGRDVVDNKKFRGKGGDVAQLTNQIAVLRARLDVFEARKAPYTEEELALFKAPGVVAAEPAPKSSKKTMRELPAGAGGLAGDAQRAFAAHHYDEAEQKYLQVLKLDDKNVFTLGNLAATQLEQNRFNDAEANLKKALAEDPGDAYSLSLLGIVKFREAKFDEALDLLSKAAEADPQNPETQNYLGITLSQKGQRVPAEAALRKALQIAPNYAGAHHNLAVVYATQQPPSIQLARWHYDKALAAGHPRNPDLEKILDQAKAK